jgi:hypothetical protein
VCQSGGEEWEVDDLIPGIEGREMDEERDEKEVKDLRMPFVLDGFDGRAWMLVGWLRSASAHILVGSRRAATHHRSLFLSSAGKAVNSTSIGFMYVGYLKE